MFQVSHTVAAPDYTTCGTYHFSSLNAAQMFVYEMWSEPVAEAYGDGRLPELETLEFEQNDRIHKVIIVEFTVYDSYAECIAERC